MEVLLNVSECNECVFKSQVFASLTKSDLCIIDANKKEIKYNSGERIVSEGEGINYFMYLKSGFVKIYKKGSNRQDQIINFARPNQFIGLLSLFSSKEYLYTISALEESVVCFVKLETIKQLIKDNGVFAYSLLEKMSKVSDSILKNRFDLSSKQLRGRIAYVLIFFSRYIYDSLDFNLPVSRKEIANFIEMRIENVVRTLSEFRKDDIITIEGKIIGIKDMKRLEEICKLG